MLAPSPSQIESLEGMTSLCKDQDQLDDTFELDSMAVEPLHDVVVDTLMLSLPFPLDRPYKGMRCSSRQYINQ